MKHTVALAQNAAASRHQAKVRECISMWRVCKLCQWEAHEASLRLGMHILRLQPCQLIAYFKLVKQGTS